MLLGRQGKSIVVVQGKAEDDMRSVATAYENPLLPHTHVGVALTTLASPLPCFTLTATTISTYAFVTFTTRLALGRLVLKLIIA